MEKLLDFVGLTNHRRIRGVDSNELFKNFSYLEDFEHANDIKLDFEKHRENENFTSTTWQPPFTHRTGNWLSFLFLFKELASLSSSQPFLILEDDVDLKTDFAGLLAKSIQLAPIDWEILLCGYVFHQPNKKKTIPQSIKRIWIPIDFFLCLHCFVLRNSSIAAQLANHLDVPVFTSATDVVITSLIKSHNLVVYGAKNPMAVQRRDLFTSNTKDPGEIPQFKLENSAIELMKNKNII